jgi:magnesium-transporting ATPase (P-type)
VVKGAPDAVMPLCRGELSGARTALDAMTARGLRVLAVAERPILGAVLDRAEDAERDLKLLGLLGLEDPPRPAASAAIEACRRAGMKVAMVTGDHPATARAIAHEVGLHRDGAPVVEGAQLPADDELGEFLDRDGIVISRVEPEDKLRIARALRARGHVVAMTGDGVNDGPALHEADIGIAMGRSGTDVAREAADLVLLDDDFSTIVAAIEQGRATFANVRRFLTYHLTDNVAELTPFVVWALSGGHIPLAIGVLQVLALDIGTDTLPAVALGAEPPAPHTLEQPPAHGHLLDRNVLRRVFGVLGATEATVAMVAFFAVYLSAGWRPGRTFAEGATLLAASGATFAAIVLGQAANAFACRSSTRSPLALRLRTNPLLVVAVAVELGLLSAFLWFPPLANLLDQAPPTAAGWVVVAMAPIALLAVDGLDKRLRRNSARHPA